MKLSTTLYVPTTFSCTGISGKVSHRSILSIVRKGAVGKRVLSRAKRSVVKISILMGNAAVKAIASFSNGCALRIPDKGGVLRVSCVNCGAGRVAVKGGDLVGVGVRPSARTLSRIIMVNCNAIGGHSLANTITSVGGRSIAITPADGIVRTLRKGVTNVSVIGSDKRINRSISVLLHNSHSVCNDGRPLFVVSNVPKDCDRIGPSSVRDISMLGSTSSATVCNSTKTGNMIVVAAGHKGRKGTAMGFSTCCNFDNSPGCGRNVIKSR